MTRLLRWAGRVEPEVVTELIDNFLTTARERMAAIDEAVQRIREAPESFPLWKAELSFRKFVIDRFPFLVF